MMISLESPISAGVLIYDCLDIVRYKFVNGKNSLKYYRQLSHKTRSNSQFTKKTVYIQVASTAASTYKCAIHLF